MAHSRNCKKCFTTTCLSCIAGVDAAPELAPDSVLNSQSESGPRVAAVTEQQQQQFVQQMLEALANTDNGVSVLTTLSLTKVLTQTLKTRGWVIMIKFAVKVNGENISSVVKDEYPSTQRDQSSHNTWASVCGATFFAYRINHLDLSSIARIDLTSKPKYVICLNS